jgi:3-hydroxybutyryl-CoA dehydratase
MSQLIMVRVPAPRAVAPVKIGDTIKVIVTVTEKRDDKRIIKLRTTASNQRGEMVIDGSAVIKKLGR